MNHFMDRPKSDKHSSDMFSYINNIERKIYEPLEMVFSRKRAVYQEPSKDDDIETILARDFYLNHYALPIIHYGAADGAIENIDDFLKDVVLKKGQEDRNNINYLLGEVGVGKTSFINYLITKLFKSFVNEKRIWFIRVDIEYSFLAKEFKLNDLIYLIIKDACKIYKKYSVNFPYCDNSIAKFNELLVQNDPNKNIYDIIERFQDFVHKLHTNGKRLVLIIDNIDYLCHFNETDTFNNITINKNQNIFVLIADCIQMFCHQRDLGRLGANVLIVTRKDSYDIITKTQSYSNLSPTKDHEKIYYLESPDLKVAVKARCDLLSKSINHNDLNTDGKDILRTIYTILTEAIEKNDKLLKEHFFRPSNGGLRSLIEFFAIYGWSQRHFRFPILFESIHLGSMVFMLNHKVRFSETESLFPNLYQIHYKSNNKLFHSYWLKYLILKFLERSDLSNIEQLIDIFYDSGNGYPKDVIEFSLGTLKDTTNNNCIRVTLERNFNKNGQLSIIKVGLTERGKYCISTAFDKFYYLQLIVEDPNLYFPISILSYFDFSILDNAKIDYSYLIDPYQYTEKSKIMIEIKTRQVLLFLKILEISYTIERQIYSSVFNNLDKLGTTIPTVDTIRCNILTELNSLNSHFNSFLNIELIISQVNQLSDRIKEDIELQYSIYRKSPSKRRK
jgi:GTPase SAR1 family protein